MVPLIVSSSLRKPSDGKGQPISWWMLFWSVLAVLLSAAVYLKIFLMGEDLRSLYRGFGTELPFLTQYVLASYRYFGILTLVGLVPCVSLLVNRCGLGGDEVPYFVVVLAGFGLSLAVMAVFVVAMYLPVFMQG